jgi:hypothetical protein
MISLHQRLAAVTDRTANLTAQLRELNELRERVRKAELALGSRRADHRKRTRIRSLTPLNRSGKPSRRARVRYLAQGPALRQAEADARSMIRHRSLPA